jgi:hypothetical protein
MKLKVTFYVVTVLISVFVIIYFVSDYFRDSEKNISEKEIIKEFPPPNGNPGLTGKQNSPDTVQLSSPLKSKSDKRIKNNDVLTEKTKAGNKLIAYYFHPNARCQTCLNIENLTKEVI